MTDIRYLTGFTGSSAILVVAGEKRYLITDFRYSEQSREEVGERAEVLLSSKGLRSAARRLLSKLRVRRLGFEALLPYGFYDYIKGGVAAMVPFEDAVLRLRSIKDEEEKALIREAVRRAEDAFRAVRPRIRAGVTERSIALRLEEKMRRLGCKGLPFEIIVASGPNSSRPHASATGRELRPGDLLTIDWGGEAGGYCSDMTRTFLIKGGRGLARKKEIYSVVLEAQQKATKAARAGISARELDAVARTHIEASGYGREFGHGLGHGVGLDVHELPRVSRHVGGRIRAGQVFTIEPGVYVPGLGGVRIEDMVVAGENGPEVLTSLPRGLQSI